MILLHTSCRCTTAWSDDRLFIILGVVLQRRVLITSLFDIGTGVEGSYIAGVGGIDEEVRRKLGCVNMHTSFFAADLDSRADALVVISDQYGSGKYPFLQKHGWEDRATTGIVHEQTHWFAVLVKKADPDYSRSFHADVTNDRSSRFANAWRAWMVGGEGNQVSL